MDETPNQENNTARLRKSFTSWRFRWVKNFPAINAHFLQHLHNTFAETNQSLRARDYAKPQQSTDCSDSKRNDVISCSNPKK